MQVPDGRKVSIRGKQRRQIVTGFSEDRKIEQSAFWLLCLCFVNVREEF